jgi:predicted DNA-binding protein (MmcQ/YjbR family)
LSIGKPLDKLLEKVRTICLALPEACEVEAWGHPTFRAGKKMFAGCGEDGGDFTLGMKMSHERQDELLEDERFYPTPYAAPQGWVSLRLSSKTDWTEIRGLLLEAYSQVVNQRMLKALDGPSLTLPARTSRTTGKK